MPGVLVDHAARPFPWTAVPAAVALLACAGLTVLVVFRAGRPDVAVLDRRAAAALAAGDPATAQLDYQHLVALEPGEPRHAFGLARALDASKRRAEAIAVLGTVAPRAGGGYAPAHLLTAEWMIEARMLRGTGDPAAMRIAAAHLDAASADPELRARVKAQREIVDPLLAGDK